MPVIIVVERLIRLGLLAWVDFRRWPVFLPFVLTWLLHAGLYVVVGDPTHPLWSGALVPLIERAFGESYLHYPQAYIGLPVTASGIRLPLDIFLFALLGVWTVSMSAQLHRGQKPRTVDARSDLKRHTLFAITLSVCVSAVWFLAYVIPVRTVLHADALGGQERQLFTYAWGFIPPLLLTPFLYVLPARQLHGGSVAKSIRFSAKTARQDMVVSIILSSTPYLFGFVTSLLLMRSARVANALRPELIVALMCVQSIVSLAAAFLVMNSATRIGISRMRSM